MAQSGKSSPVAMPKSFPRSASSSPLDARHEQAKASSVPPSPLRPMHKLQVSLDAERGEFDPDDDENVSELVRKSSACGSPHSPQHFTTTMKLLRLSVEKTKITVDSKEAEEIFPATPTSPKSPKPAYLRRVPLSPKPGKPLTEQDADSDNEDRFTARSESKTHDGEPVHAPSKHSGHGHHKSREAKIDLRPEERLIAASYNMHGGVAADGGYDIHGAEVLLASLHCDLVGLQEVEINHTQQHTRSWSAKHQHDHVKMLSKAAGLPHTAFACMMKATYNPETKTTDKKTGQGEFGIAVLSRYPILETRTKAFTAGSGKPQRVALAVRVQPTIFNDGTSIWFVTTHFSQQVVGKKQARQAHELLLFLEELYKDTGHDVLVCGDLNCSPWFAASKTLRKSKTAFGYLIDLWKTFGLGEINASRALGLSGITSCGFFRSVYLMASESLFSRATCLGVGQQEGQHERKLALCVWRAGADTTSLRTPSHNSQMLTNPMVAAIKGEEREREMRSRASSSSSNDSPTQESGKRTMDKLSASAPTGGLMLPNLTIPGYGQHNGVGPGSHHHSSSRPNSPPHHSHSRPGSAQKAPSSHMTAVDYKQHGQRGSMPPNFPLNRMPQAPDAPPPRKSTSTAPTTPSSRQAHHS